MSKIRRKPDLTLPPSRPTAPRPGASTPARPAASARLARSMPAPTQHRRDALTLQAFDLQPKTMRRLVSPLGPCNGRSSSTERHHGRSPRSQPSSAPRTDSLPFWNDVCGTPSVRCGLPLGALPYDGPAPTAAQFRASLGRTPLKRSHRIQQQCAPASQYLLSQLVPTPR